MEPHSEQRVSWLGYVPSLIATSLEKFASMLAAFWKMFESMLFSSILGKFVSSWKFVEIMLQVRRRLELRVGLVAD